MSTALVRRVTEQICHELLRHYQEFREPITASQLQNRFIAPLKRGLGPATSMVWFLEQLEKLSIVVIIRAKRGKRWVYLRDTWEGFDEYERDCAIDFCYTAPDPYQEYKAVRESRVQDRMTVISRALNGLYSS